MPPAWDLTNEYRDFESDEFKGDQVLLNSKLEQLAALGKELNPFLCADGLEQSEFEKALPLAHAMQELLREAGLIYADLSAYTSCFLAVESGHVQAKKIRVRLQELGGAFEELVVPLRYFLATISKEQTEQFLKNKIALDSKYTIQRLREHSYQRMLSPEEEKLQAGNTALATHPWWNLYETNATSLRIEVEVDGLKQTIGLSQTNEFLSSPNREVRRTVWHSIQGAWGAQKESAAAGINALAAWRIKDDVRRSAKRAKHFLDNSLHSAGITRKTLESMMNVLRENLATGQKALLLLARASGVDSYEPWDMFAPFPPNLARASSGKLNFADALNDLEEAFAQFHPELGNFVRLCSTKNWIEARSLPTKRPGAFSSGFIRSGEPRTYLNWTGTKDDARIFAHETGHSHHTWVMRDLPPEQRDYPMTLAETASNMGEMLFMDRELSRADSPEAELAVLWEDLRAGITYLINIPLRFEFEHEVYRRRQAEMLTATELSNLMVEMHARWYGSVMKNPDPLFWASKGHFHLTGISFYNFPYSFGYLFATGVHSVARERGKQFYDSYVALLRDTGRMSAEDIALKHLNENLDSSDFWQRGYDAFARKVSRFEQALKKIGL